MNSTYRFVLVALILSAPLIMAQTPGGGTKAAVANGGTQPRSSSSPAAPPATQPSVARTDAVPARQAAPAPAVASKPLRAMAISDFGWATVQTYVQEIFRTRVDIGKGVRSLMTTRLREGGNMKIVERADLDALLKEQDFGGGNRVKQGTNARIGKITGADLYLMGDIVAFGRDDRKEKIDLGAINRRLSGIGGVWSKEDKAVVVIDYRLIDTETSEVLDAGEARGESSRKSKGFGGLLIGPAGAIGGSTNMESSNFAQTIIGEATIDASNKLAAIMNAKIPSLPRKQVDVEAYVAAVSRSGVILNKGAVDGVVVGDRFEVFRILGDVKDPITGEVLDRKVTKVGTLTITSITDRTSTGSYVGGAATVGTSLARKILN